MSAQTTFALYFGNRGFFPESLIASARRELTTRLDAIGINSICMPEEATRYGAVETSAEGRVYAEFLASHRDEYQGVILCLPNFGDENGAAEALRDCGVPIYILAYPDELDKMDFASRRDAFCGKLSIMDVFSQYKIPFTAWEPHTLSPASDEFAGQMREFAAVCRIVDGMKRCRIGAIGARPTAFKTIRFDETTLQKYGITVEVFDNSDLLLEMDKITDADPDLAAKIKRFKTYTDFSEVPPDKLTTLSRLSLALDRIIEEYQLDALGLALLVRSGADVEHFSLCRLERTQRPGLPGCLRTGYRQRGGDVRAAACFSRTGHLSGLEQQLRRRSGQMHPVPLRSGAAVADDGQRQSDRPSDVRQGTW